MASCSQPTGPPRRTVHRPPSCGMTRIPPVSQTAVLVATAVSSGDSMLPPKSITQRKNTSLTLNHPQPTDAPSFIPPYVSSTPFPLLFNPLHLLIAPPL